MSNLPPHPTSLPTLPIPPSTAPLPIAHSLFSNFPHLTARIFTKDALWRDCFALTGSLRTFHSPVSIITAWRDTCLLANVNEDSFCLDEGSVRVIRVGAGGAGNGRGGSGSAWIEASFGFEVEAGRGVGILSAVRYREGEGGGKGEGEWRIWVLRTILEGLRGVGSVDCLEPGTVSGEERTGRGEGGRESEGMGGGREKFEAVVIGGGLAGLSTGGRLKALGVKYVVLDRNENVGDNWRLRYGSARLHTNREYAHLPFERTFGPEYQEYLSKDDLAKGYSEWVEKFDINIWQSTTVLTGSTWDESQQLWTLKLKRGGKECSIRSSFVVLAGGAGGQVPILPPDYEDLEKFEGITMHSIEYRDAKAWKGKHGIVVGTANTAHDVAEDMVEAGLASVTMIQRSRTYVMPAEYWFKIATRNYNATTPTEVADRSSLTNPYAIADLISQAALRAQVMQEPERFDALERAGFRVERFGSIQEHLLIRGGGHYMDVGGSGRIVGGSIKVQSNALPTRYTKYGVVLSDGTFLKADIIVFATGFEGNMRSQVEEIFGKEVADLVGDYWMLDGEGELRGAVKPTGHPAIWLHGGTIGQGRYYSRFIALQIKAKLTGRPLPLYEKRP